MQWLWYNPLKRFGSIKGILLRGAHEFFETRMFVYVRWKINRVKWGSDNKSSDSVCVYMVVILYDSILETCKYLKCATCSAAAHMSKVEKNGAIFFPMLRVWKL